MNKNSPYGWCPSALRPMPAQDGLLLRIRTLLNELTAQQAHGIAELATRFGSAIIELTTRANLQIRGVSAGAFPALIEGLERLGLLDIDRSPSARINIVLDPLRGTAADDAQTLSARLLGAGLAGAEFAALPHKFGFAVDAGPGRHLAAISGDIRIEAGAGTLLVRAAHAALGAPARDSAEAADKALDLARWFLAAGGVGADGRGRMHALIARGARPPRGLAGTLAPNPAVPLPDARGAWHAAPDGRCTADALHRIAERAGGPIRLTPFRAFYLPACLSAYSPTTLASRTRAGADNTASAQPLNRR